jgi:KDO2-lipid IV(A) lauroyltransferase
VARRSPARDFVTFLPQGLLLAVARALPYRARLGFGALVARLLVAVVPELRARVDNNLRLIHPEMTALERRRIRRGVADNFGRTFVELMTSESFRARAPWTGPSGPGWAAFEAARQAGGVLLVSGHFGQWEAVRGVLKARGIEAGALYRPFKNPWLERSYLGHLEDMGQPIFNRDRSGLRELVRHLKSGGVVCVLLDQHTKRGLPVDFLGEPAPSGTMIAELALKFRVPMIPAYGTRDADGVRIAVDFEAPIPATTADEMTRAAADSLAARVRARPEQYFWLHQRWVKWN